MTKVSKLSALRKLMQSHNVKAYIIPTQDAHQSEYISSRDTRREFISSFTGSAGTAVVLDQKALLWTDGRYYLQASQQLSSEWELMKQGLEGVPSINEFLKQNLQKEDIIGIDPLLFTYFDVEEMKREGLNIQAFNENLVDAVWEDQPPLPSAPIKSLGLEFAGQDSSEKIAAVQKLLAKKNVWGLIVSALDEIAWLFNLRGSDIEFNPVFMAYAIVTLDQVILYVDQSKMDDETKSSLNKVQLKNYNDIFADLKNMAGNFAPQPVLIDKKCNLALVNALGNTHFVIDRNPIETLKSIKNDTEIKGFFNCHQRDAVALCKYFNWLEKQLKNGVVISEAEGADKLAEFRSKCKDFKGLSFDTISSTGPNGAIIHYKPEHGSCANIHLDQIYLCDSGGQYSDGTTDVTRTMHFGTPTEEEKECYTRVLQGHIRIDMLKFPKGTTGYRIDTMARSALWEVGLDFRHGTGHGVGSYLNVHEGPQGIGFRINQNDVPLSPGMTITNEPGFYNDGKFGIRIENVLIVKKAETKYNFQNTEFYEFESCTVVPIQTKLINKSLLSEREVNWVNAYNQRCFEALKDDMAGDDLEWLKRECTPI